MESCDLSSDIIYEILTRSSMETVGRCRLLSKECNSITYDSVFSDLHRQRTDTMSGYFMQSMLSSRFYSSFVSMDDWRSYPKLSLNFLPDRVEIQASTNQGILLCLTIHPRYYVCKPTTQQWQKIPNPKTRYHTLATGMIVIGSNPLHYKIVRFSKPRFRCHDKEFYRYCRFRCELFDSKTWMWRQLDEVKLPNHGSFSRKPAVSVSGSLHWLTYVQNNIFAFHVNKESYSLFSLPLSDSEDDKGKDIALVEYMGKLAITCIGKDKSYMELWVMENYGEIEWNKRYKINMEAFRKEPYTRPVAFYNADIVLMKELDHRVTFFNFKNGSTDRLSLENELNHGCFRFQSDFEPSDLTGGFALKHPQGERRRSKSKRRKSLIL
ncbi:F-box protein [Salix suchowensis]|nr:F-box protein [Salix suchowensis]